MKTFEYPARETWKKLTLRPQLESKQLENTVRNIIDKVRTFGDAALIGFTEQLDHVKIISIEVSRSEWNEAESQVSEELKNAITIAAANIQKFHSSQRRETLKIETMPGVTCWRRDLPIGRIGIYIPGGSAPLFSTVLMLGIPAKLAGCKEILLCSPPGLNGKIHPAILFAAQLVGVTRVFNVGGAQAIAGMAYGTESIPAVDKIFGPGNQYVTKAKQLVNQSGIAIDLPAGPSEVLVIADESSNPVFVAADLLSQAEHGSDSQVVIVTRCKPIIESILEEVEKKVQFLPRKEIAMKSLKNSLAVLFSSDDEIIDFVNEYAPEHLIIQTENCDELSEHIENAGSVFLGPYSAESAGDYASGTNHTLPTQGFAKSYSGVSLESFTKSITFQKITGQGLRNLGPIVETMASAEQLEGHRESISVRLRSLQ